MLTQKHIKKYLITLLGLLWFSSIPFLSFASEEISKISLGYEVEAIFEGGMFTYRSEPCFNILISQLRNNITYQQEIGMVCEYYNDNKTYKKIKLILNESRTWTKDQWRPSLCNGGMEACDNETVFNYIQGKWILGKISQNGGPKYYIAKWSKAKVWVKGCERPDYFDENTGC